MIAQVQDHIYLAILTCHGEHMKTLGRSNVREIKFRNTPASFLGLLSGDTISTGTPKWVIPGMPEDRIIGISRGDRVSIQIKCPGRPENMYS